MRKEVLIAIILGVGLGIVVAFGVWRANLAFSTKTPQPVSSISPINQQSNNTSVPSSLLVTQPEDNLVISKDKVTIKGSTTPKTTVAISTNVDNAIIQSDKDGGFEKEMSLDGGPNEIIIKSFDNLGNESQQKLTVVYSTEFQE